MDGTLHLISFFENPYRVGSVTDHVHPGGVENIIGPSKTSHQDRSIIEGSNIFGGK